MKRSEMKEKISKLIHEYRRCTEGVTSDELGEWVLSLVEQEGMSPPSHYRETNGEWNDSALAIWDNDKQRIVGWKVLYQEWEPERE